MTAKLRVLDLFSGIGGFSLGLRRGGEQAIIEGRLWHQFPDVPETGQLSLFGEAT